MAMGLSCRTSQFSGFGRCKSYLEARVGFVLESPFKGMLLRDSCIGRASARARGADSVGD